jgi:hypothetical protein
MATERGTKALSKLEATWQAQDETDRQRLENPNARRVQAAATKSCLREILKSEPSDSATFALSLVALARAWSVYPGHDAYWRYPLAACSRAEQLGKKIWESAIRGWSRGRLEKLHRKAVEIAAKCAARSTPKLKRDSADGLLDFFRQLDNYYWEGPMSAGAVAWQPPEFVAEVEQATSVALEAAHARAITPRRPATKGARSPQLRPNEITATEVYRTYDVNRSTVAGWCGSHRSRLRVLRWLQTGERVFDREDVRRHVEAWRPRRALRKRSRGRK